MQQYDNHLVSGAALRTTLEELHTDQQRQDGAIGNVEAQLPLALSTEEIAELWINS